MAEKIDVLTSFLQNLSLSDDEKEFASSLPRTLLVEFNGSSKTAREIFVRSELRNKALVEKKEVLEEEKVALVKEKKDVSIAEKGLPPLHANKFTTGAGAARPNHHPATVEVKTFRLLTALPSAKIVPSLLWISVSKEGRLEVENEDGVHDCVGNALTDLVKAYFEGFEVKVVKKKVVTKGDGEGHEFPDGVVVKYQVIVPGLKIEFVIGVVEVKCPSKEHHRSSSKTEKLEGGGGGKRSVRIQQQQQQTSADDQSSSDPLDDANVLGQLYDYMEDARITQGVMMPIGILTSYDQWRICWLPCADKLAEAEVEASDGLQAAVESLRRKMATEEGGAAATEKGGAAATATGRCFHATTCIQWDDKVILFKHVLTAILKMLSSPIEQWDGSSPKSGTDLRQLTQDGVWKKFSFKGALTHPSPTSLLPHVNCKSFTFLKNLGEGRDAARVWMVCAGQDNHVAVLKFRNNIAGKSPQELVNDEVEAWNTIYGKDHARAVQFAKTHHAVLMPYLSPIENKRAHQEGIRNCLLKWVQSGWQHNDLCWRHFYSLGSTGDVYLIDLSAVSPCTPLAAESEACSQLVEELLVRLNAQKDDNEKVSWR